MVRRGLLAVLALGLLAPASFAGTQLFPGRRIFAPLVADPADPRLAAQYIGARAGSLVGYEFHVGAAVPLVQWDLDPATGPAGAPPAAVQIGAETDVQFFIDDGAHFPLQDADFHVGLPIDYRSGDFAGRLRLGHTSSHIGDDFLRRHQSFPLRRFNREFVTLLPSYTLGPARAYAGGGYILHSDPGLPREMTQWGVELDGPMLWAERLGTYAAGDFQAKAENDFAIRTNLQVGVVLQAPPDHRLRCGFRFYEGPSALGQFFQERQQWLGVGLSYSPTLGLPRPAP